MSTPWNPRSIIWIRQCTEAVPCPCCEDQTSADCPLCEGIGEVSSEMALDFLGDDEVQDATGNAPEITCPSCDGTGRVMYWQFEDPESGTESFQYEGACDGCGGHGTVTAERLAALNGAEL